MLTLEAIRLRQGPFELVADLSVGKGSMTAIIGPSGAGKSTLVGIIGGFVAPDAGRVIWNGQDLQGTSPGQRPVSTVFQDNNLFPHLSVFQNIALGIAPSLKLNSAQFSLVRDALSRVGLDDLEDRKPAALSGGQQSRVALARVLVRDKPLLLLDEPFSALGPALRGEMLDLVADLACDTGATMLMVTHEPRDALRIADQTVLVADGVAYSPQPTGDLLTNPPQVLRDYLGT